MDRDKSPQQPGKQRGALWRGVRLIAGSPFAFFGYRRIADNASMIRSLIGAIRSGPQADPRVRLAPDRTLDVTAMAWEARLSPAEIERQLGNRKRQTVLATFLYLLGAGLFLALTFYRAIVTLPVLPTLSYLLTMTSICCCFCCMAFHNALVNWQIRTRRLGSAREFLNASETWWPS